MDLQLGNYLRSQFTDAVVFGVLATIALWLLGVKYFLFIGVFAGLANLIPYVGPIAGALPAVAVALFDAGDVTLALQIVLAFIILKLTDDMLVQPLLVAKGVHMHPLLVLMAIIIGGELFGMLGMLLAVPATGFAKVESAVASGAVCALIHASDGAADGKRKLGQALRRQFGPEGRPEIGAFAIDELDSALGRGNVVHAALGLGPAAKVFLASARRFAVYRGDDDMAAASAGTELNKDKALEQGFKADGTNGLGPGTHD